MTLLRSCAVLLLVTLVSTGCDKNEAPTSDESESATTSENSEKTRPPEQAAEEDESEPADKSAETEEPPPELEGPAPDRAVLRSELEAQEERADETLKGDTCKGFTDLEKCRTDEAEDDWKTAAECYRNYVVVGGPDPCRAAQFVKAAANYERAEKREAAVDARMEVVDTSDTPTAATVDAADFMLETGSRERASALYSSYLDAHPDSKLADYAQAQCQRMGGCESSGDASAE